jgi:hypothetical protein
MNVRRVATRLAVAGALVVIGTSCVYPGQPPGPTTPGTIPGDHLDKIIELKDFRAYVDVQTPEPKLVVKGTIVVPSGGYQVKLQPASPQGIDPRILLLDLKVISHGGNYSQAYRPLAVSLEASPDYDLVTVRNIGLDLPVERSS